MIGLRVVADLNERQSVHLLVKGVRPFLLHQRFHILKHRLRQRPLQDDFVRPLVGIMEVSVNLRELLLQVVCLEIDEFILDVAYREECPYSIAHTAKQRPIWVVRVLVCER